VTGEMNTLAQPLFSLWRADHLPRLLAPYQGTPLPARLHSVQGIVDTARQALPDTVVVSIMFSNIWVGSPRHYLIWTRGTTPLTSCLFTPVLIDAETGQLTPARGLPWYLRALQVSRSLHFSDYGGLPLKILWALLDIITIVVLGRGVRLWFTRGKASIEARMAESERQEAASPCSGCPCCWRSSAPSASRRHCSAMGSGMYYRGSRLAHRSPSSSGMWCDPRGAATDQAGLPRRFS
jgi:hypothetical protein